MTLWTPPGAHLGEDDGPAPDKRMDMFMGGFDAAGLPTPITYRRARSIVDGWPTTAATPEGPASLLKAAGDMFALGFYSYELIACSSAWALFAVEAALRLRLEAGERVQFARLVQKATEAGLIRPDRTERLGAGRKLRNNFVHEGTQPTWPIGMAAGVVRNSFQVIAELYPDDTEAHRLAANR